MTADDEKALALFMSLTKPKKMSLGDIIMVLIVSLHRCSLVQAKLREHNEKISPEEIAERMQRRLNPKVFKVYRGYD